MSKKKILSILIISLMVLGVVMFVVDSLRAGQQEFDGCVDYCFEKAHEGYSLDLCIALHTITVE